MKKMATETSVDMVRSAGCVEIDDRPRMDTGTVCTSTYIHTYIHVQYILYTKDPGTLGMYVKVPLDTYPSSILCLLFCFSPPYLRSHRDAHQEPF